MCGIAGIVRTDGNEVEPAVVRKMIGRIRHRGPDSEGYWQEGPVALGHCRLAIRDLTSAGAQPFASHDGRVVVVYNGEIYNHQALAAELAAVRGFVPRTECDTELIPEAYLAWGPAAFERFEGMFAVGLWDRAERRLVLARDGIGIKPLYLWENDSEIGFASEIKAALAGRSGSARLCPSDIAHMLALGYPAPDRTLVEGLRQLQPGTVWVRDDAGRRERRFWRPTRPLRPIEYPCAHDRFVELFKTVVDQQLVSDVPVGVMQSGGIDSSLVSLALPKNQDIALFCVRFNEASHDESILAQKLAATAGRRIEWVDLPAGRDIESDFDCVVRAVDGHLADSSTLAEFLLCRALRAHVKVALSGDGADEFFGGYQTYAASVWAQRIRGMLSSETWIKLATRAQLSAGVSTARLTRREKAYRFLAGLAHETPHVAWRHYLAPWKRRRLYGPALADAHASDPLAAYSNAMRGDEDLVDRCLLADQTYYLPADMLVKVDRASMANGLEVRVPFLDQRIMEFASQIPNTLMLGPAGATKKILREALASLAGPVDVVRGRKRGFNVPMNALLRGGLKPLADRLLARDADVFAPYLSPDGVRQLWLEHASGQCDEKYVVWTLLTLGTWLQYGEVA